MLNYKGFTGLEVVAVVALSGVVWIALPNVIAAVTKLVS